MNAQKFTQKSLEALQAAQDFATEYENMQIEQPHLLAALTAQEDGLIGQMLKKMAIDASAMQHAVKTETYSSFIRSAVFSACISVRSTSCET